MRNEIILNGSPITFVKYRRKEVKEPYLGEFRYKIVIPKFNKSSLESKHFGARHSRFKTVDDIF